jgi:uroporphyrinogen-III synthase
MRQDIPEKKNFDIAFVSSSSNADAFKKMGLNAKIIVSIGPETSNGLTKNGINPTIEADTHTLSGMLEALLDYLIGCDNFDKNKI